MLKEGRPFNNQGLSKAVTPLMADPAGGMNIAAAHADEASRSWATRTRALHCKAFVQCFDSSPT
jgi:hypothetical protein